MLRSPLARILLPLVAVIVLSALASLYLKLSEPRSAAARAPLRGAPSRGLPGPPTANSEAPASPYKPPRVALREHSDYDRHLSIGPDGGIYTLLHSVFTARGGDGGLRWQFDTGHDDASGYAVARDSTVYISCGGGHIWALSPAGELLWEADLLTAEQRVVRGGEQIPGVSVPYHSEPVVTPDGGVHFILGQSVVAFNRDGSRRYRLDMTQSSAPEDAQGNPHPEWGRRARATLQDLLPGYDDTVYVTLEQQLRDPGDGLRSIGRDGRLRWKRETRGRVYVAPGHDLLLENHPDGLSAYDKDWRELWHSEVTPSMLDFDSAGNIYCLTWPGDLVALSPAGQLRWSAWVTGSQLQAGGSGPLYVLDKDGSRVIAFDKGSGAELWHSVPPDDIRSLLANEYGFFLSFLAAAPDGTAYFSGTGGWLFAAGP